MDLYCIFIVVCVKRKVRFTKPFLVVAAEAEAKRYVYMKKMVDQIAKFFFLFCHYFTFVINFYAFFVPPASSHL